MKEYKFIISADQHKIRFDKALSILIPHISRTAISQAIKSGSARLNNLIIIDASTLVKENDSLSLLITTKSDVAYKLMPVPMELDIIFEDEHLIILNKPAGLIVHPGDNVHEQTLVHGLIYYTQNLSTVNGYLRPGIVHRIDKDTSGLMVVAKTDLAHHSLAEQLRDRTLSRKYKAFVWDVLSPLSGNIDANIGRNPSDRTKRAALKYGGKPATTHYQTEQIWQNGLLSRVECTLDTGRTHQIRVHLSYVGCSVFGDQVYGQHNRKVKTLALEIQEKVKNFKRQALHSWQIKLIHPISGELMEFKISLPADMQYLESILKF